MAMPMLPAWATHLNAMLGSANNSLMGGNVWLLCPVAAPGLFLFDFTC